MSKEILDGILKSINEKSSELIVDMEGYHREYKGFEENYSDLFHRKFSDTVLNIITYSANLITNLPTSMEVKISDLLDFNKDLMKVTEKLNYYFVLYWGKSPNPPLLSELDTDY